MIRRTSIALLCVAVLLGGCVSESTEGDEAPQEFSDAVRRFIEAENNVRVIPLDDRVDDDFRPLVEASNWSLTDARGVIGDSYLSSLGPLDLAAVLLWTVSGDRAIVWACFQQDEVFSYPDGEVYKLTSPREMIYELHRGPDQVWRVNYRVADGDPVRTPEFDPDGKMPRSRCS